MRFGPLFCPQLPRGFDHFYGAGRGGGPTLPRGAGRPSLVVTTGIKPSSRSPVHFCRLRTAGAVTYTSAYPFDTLVSGITTPTTSIILIQCQMPRHPPLPRRPRLTWGEILIGKYLFRIVIFLCLSDHLCYISELTKTRMWKINNQITQRYSMLDKDYTTTKFQ